MEDKMVAGAFGSIRVLTFSLAKMNLTQPRKLLNPELSNETTQMKALDEYFLMVVFTLLLNRVHDFTHFMFNLNRETWQWTVKGKEPGMNLRIIAYLDWHDAWNDWYCNSNVSTVFQKLEKCLILKEELGDDEVCSGIDFLLQMLEVFFITRAIWVTSRIT